MKDFSLIQIILGQHFSGLLSAGLQRLLHHHCTAHGNESTRAALSLSLSLSLSSLEAARSAHTPVTEGGGERERERAGKSSESTRCPTTFFLSIHRTPFLIFCQGILHKSHITKNVSN